MCNTQKCIIDIPFSSNDFYVQPHGFVLIFFATVGSLDKFMFSNLSYIAMFTRNKRRNLLPYQTCFLLLDCPMKVLVTPVNCIRSKRYNNFILANKYCVILSMIHGIK